MKKKRIVRNLDQRIKAQKAKLFQMEHRKRLAYLGSSVGAKILKSGTSIPDFRKKLRHVKALDKSISVFEIYEYDVTEAAALRDLLVEELERCLKRS